jgi:antitoxin StbD
MEIIDDYHLSLEVDKALKDNEKAIRVNLDEL